MARGEASNDARFGAVAEMRVAAFQNGYFTALCNRVGEEECLAFGGESFVCDPNGSVIARAPAAEDVILNADVDLNQVSRSHARRLFLRDEVVPGVAGEELAGGRRVGGE